MMTIVPVFIMPIFNKYELLQDGPLKTRVQRIVLIDTLMEQMSNDETLAILYTVLRPAAIKRVGTNVLCLNAVDVNLDG
jgi:hypothetical protein